jgi:2-iminobutanoate/2-iminopropanoate deaminase
VPRFFNPATVAAPASRYSHAVEHATTARRLVISGQVGVRADGALADGFEAQMEAAFDNLLSILADAGMEAADLVKISVFATVPGSVAAYRSIRDRRLAGHAPAATYLEVAGLARPEWLVEIEAEAVRE